MLAFAVRGVVLLGVLSWYSATVWKMIDGYFKDQFRTYLKEEYNKYPRIKADVDKRTVPSSLPAESILSHGESYDPDAVCSADIADICQQYAAASSEWKPTEAVTAGGTSENAAFVGSPDKNAFLVGSELESRKLPLSSSDIHDEKEQTSTIIHQESDRKQVKSEIDNGVLEDSTSFQRREKLRRRSEKRTADTSKKISREISREKSKKQRAKTIVPTDFTDTKITDDGDDDFSEFEEEERKESESISKEGILVTELPFKPKVDISGLDRVSAEEFCPLENEASCAETTTWP